MDVSRSDLVHAYWLQHEWATGDREHRLLAEAGSMAWACRIVDEATDIGADGVLELFEDLLAAPNADPCYIGAGPLEDLLSQHGRAWDTAVADRCRTSPLWRAAVGCVWLDAHESQGLSALALYLRKRSAE